MTSSVGSSSGSSTSGFSTPVVAGSSSVVGTSAVSAGAVVSASGAAVEAGDTVVVVGADALGSSSGDLPHAASRTSASAPAAAADPGDGIERRYRREPSDETRADRAIRLAERRLRTAAAGTRWRERRRQQRLGRIIADPAARELVQRLTDEVLRLDDPARAARRFARLVAEHGAPAALGPLDRTLLGLGARLATRAPALVMPLARARILHETRGLVLPATDPALARHIRRRRRRGYSLNLNVLGEAILSDDEAETRIARVVECMRRPDVDYVSVKISALVAQLDVLAFEHSVERISAALRR